jgi:hypothetical protein
MLDEDMNVDEAKCELCENAIDHCNECGYDEEMNLRCHQCTDQWYIGGDGQCTRDIC